jgi:VHL beta domain
VLGRAGVVLLVSLVAALALGHPASPAGGAVAAARNDCAITQTRSLTGTVRTNIEFVNRTAGAIKVYWLDYTGKRVYYNTLAAGSSYVQPTWKTHPWVVLDSGGRCIGYVIAPAARYVVTGSSAGGGTATTPTPPKHPTFTAVVCTIGVSGGSSTCTAQVADAGIQRSSPPTGTVSFTAAKGVVGKSCTLSGTPGSPGIASCTVSYIPPADLVQGEPPPVAADYAGDAAFEGSHGGSGYHPASVIGPATAVATGSGGIPTDLVNQNPFPVSADEALTVPATLIAFTSGPERMTAATAKVRTIGHARFRLKPLASIAATIKLTRAGRKLLARRRVVHATLTITTRAAGRPSRSVRRSLTIRLERP